MKFARFKTLDGYTYEVIVCGRARVYNYIGRGRNHILHPSSRNTINRALAKRAGRITRGDF